MTNKEIISSLRGLIGKYNLTDEEWQTIEKTIKVLNNSDEDCISRAEAIKAIRNYNVTIEVGRAIGKSQLVDIVDSINKVQEKMISELPSIQPTVKGNLVVEDCISRNAIIETLNEMDRYIADELTLCDSNNKFPQNEVFIVDDVYEQIAEQLPPVTPKPMQVDIEGDGYADGELVYDYGKCPKCGWKFEYGEKDWEEPYCCHCGQKLHWFESEDKE